MIESLKDFMNTKDRSSALMSIEEKFAFVNRCPVFRGYDSARLYEKN